MVSLSSAAAAAHVIRLGRYAAWAAALLVLVIVRECCTFRGSPAASGDVATAIVASPYALERTNTTTATKPTMSASPRPPRAAPPRRSLTIVTAYFNLGRLLKGNEHAVREASAYLAWMSPYRFLQNGVVAHFDDAAAAAAFSELRRGLPTRVTAVNRTELWAFSTVNRTHDLFKQPGYPKKSPKSTNAEYVAAMHAKYELVARVANGGDPFGSSHVAWMDLGIYRDLPADATSTFRLRPNPCQRDDAVMFSRVYPMATGDTLREVMREGRDWVGGGFFVARHDTMARFCADYAQRVQSFLSQGLANHDQSVLLAMYLPEAVPRPTVPLQAVPPSGSEEPWFQMAMQARRDALTSDSESGGVAGARVSCAYELHS